MTIGEACGDSLMKVYRETATDYYCANCAQPDWPRPAIRWLGACDYCGEEDWLFERVRPVVESDHADGVR